MIKARYLIASLSGAALISAGSISGVSADTPNTNNNVGNSSIPNTVFRQEVLSAAATVLNTTPTNVREAQKSHSLDNLISQSGLTKKTYRQELQDQLSLDLEKLGYSQKVIDSALQKNNDGLIRHIRRLR